MLKGKLVGLRAVERDDLAQLLEWRNRPELRRYFREYRELSSTNQEGWFNSRVLNDKSTIMFSIVDLATGNLLGACGLCYIDWVDRHADFSIYLGRDGIYIDSELAIEAAELMRRYAFDELNLHRLWSEIYDFDEPKKKMFSTLGFTLEGTQRAKHFAEGAWHDSLYYGCINE